MYNCAYALTNYSNTPSASISNGAASPQLEEHRIRYISDRLFAQEVTPLKLLVSGWEAYRAGSW